MVKKFEIEICDPDANSYSLFGLALNDRLGTLATCHLA
jgi:hypothetical protein